MTGRVKMSDIARRLGVSTVSVSNALAGRDGVSPALRQKITDTARDMGYTAPSRRAAARGVSIGVLVPERFFGETSFYFRFYRAILSQCNALGYAAVLEVVTAAAERERALPLLLEDNKAAALIFMGEIDSGYLHALTDRLSIPCLLLDFRDDSAPDALTVVGDNLDGGYCLARHLLRQGCRRLAFAGSVRATSSIMDRYLGFCRALLQEGISPQPKWLLEDRDERGELLPITLPDDMPDGFVCSCDEVAFALVEQLRRAGYRVPRDVKVTGYDDYRLPTLCNPPLTSYRVNVEVMARTALDMLRRRLEKQPIAAPRAVIPGTFVRRESA